MTCKVVMRSRTCWLLVVEYQRLYAQLTRWQDTHRAVAIASVPLFGSAPGAVLPPQSNCSARTSSIVR